LLLAAIDFNQRFSRTTPSVAEQTEGCDLYLSLRIRETNERGILPEAVWQDEVINSTMRPVGIVGAFLPGYTARLARLNSGVSKSAGPVTHPAPGEPVNRDSLPLVSPYSLYDESQNDRESYPYLARVPVEMGNEAEALCIYLKSRNVQHFAVFVYDIEIDFLGVSKKLLELAPLYEIVMHIFEFGNTPVDDPAKVDQAIDELIASGINYVLGYLSNEDSDYYQLHNRFVLDKLVDKGVLGSPDYVWLFLGSFIHQFDATSPITYFCPTEEKLANALNNTILIIDPDSLQTADDTELDESVYELVNDPDFWPYFESVRETRELNDTRSIPFSFYSQDFFIFTVWYVYSAAFS
jgi:hypothetical protein